MARGTQPRVLCVDYDEDSRLMLVALLKLAFIEAQAVSTAAQALSLIQTERFDLYMLEGRLPEIDGFELCRRLRAADPHTPIVFFSGAAYETDKKKGLEAGANAYVPKPDIPELLKSLKEFTSRDGFLPVAHAIRPDDEVFAASVASAAGAPGKHRIPQLRLVNSRSV